MMDQLQGRLEGWLVYDLAECKVGMGPWDGTSGHHQTFLEWPWHAMASCGHADPKFHKVHYEFTMSLDIGEFCDHDQDRFSAAPASGSIYFTWLQPEYV